MLFACWSVKGGSGTTTVAAALALSLAHQGPCLLVDLFGDMPSLLALPEPDGPGISDVLGLGRSAPIDALARLEIPGPLDDLRLIAAGTADAGRSHLSVHSPGSSPPGSTDPDVVGRIAAVLAADPRPVVVDCGRIVGPAAPPPLATAVVAACHRSLMVVRGCYLALRWAALSPVRPSGVVLVRETGRALGARDVGSIVGVPVVAEIDIDPAVARAIDAGLFPARLPRRMAADLRSLR